MTMDDFEKAAAAADETVATDFARAIARVDAEAAETREPIAFHLVMHFNDGTSVDHYSGDLYLLLGSLSIGIEEVKERLQESRRLGG